MAENYTVWRPIPDLPAPLYSDSILHDHQGLQVFLHCEQRPGKLRIYFENPLAYGNTNESYRVRTWQELTPEGSSSLFTVTESRFVAWFHAETIGECSSWIIKHYAIFTPEDCLDILSKVGPEVEWLDDA